MKNSNTYMCCTHRVCAMLGAARPPYPRPAGTRSALARHVVRTRTTQQHIYVFASCANARAAMRVRLARGAHAVRAASRPRHAGAVYI